MITLSNGAVIEIDDVQTPVPGVSVHRGRVRSGAVETNTQVLAQIDIKRRDAISRAHTATHMVHKRFWAKLLHRQDLKTPRDVFALISQQRALFLNQF